MALQPNGEIYDRRPRPPVLGAGRSLDPFPVRDGFTLLLTLLLAGLAGVFNFDDLVKLLSCLGLPLDLPGIFDRLLAPRFTATSGNSAIFC